MRKSKKVNLPEVGVNITPLLDVLTVLLFFLIKSSQMTSLTLDPPDGIRLPSSIVTAQAEEAIMVALTKKEITADGKTIMKLDHGEFSTNEIGEDKRTLIPLKDFLTKQIEKKKAFFKGVGDIDNLLKYDKIIIQADKSAPFEKLKYILHTAAVSGHGDYQFVVVKSE